MSSSTRSSNVDKPGLTRRDKAMPGASCPARCAAGAARPTDEHGTHSVSQRVLNSAPACSMRGHPPQAGGSRAPTDRFTAARGAKAPLRKVQIRCDWPCEPALDSKVFEEL